jgi:two-component system response regulator PilR (NtrC family)
MQQVRTLIEKVARSMAPVLVQGSRARARNWWRAPSTRCRRAPGSPFVAVNCGAIPEHLLEAEFFGYRKGAFTGANEDREGFFQAAHGGTLFLDEIGDLPLAMQSKLLRVIQERAVRPLGARPRLPINVRIVSATHKDLAAEVAGSRFRQDLYYRLNVIQIRVPPLRERLEDLPTSAPRCSSASPTMPAWPPPELARRRWRTCALHLPGQCARAREPAAPRRGAVGGRSDRARGPRPARANWSWSPSRRGGRCRAWRPAAPHRRCRSKPLPDDLAAYLDAVERDILSRALERHRYNRTAAGASLGLSLRQMRYRMARLGIAATRSSAAMAPWSSFEPNKIAVALMKAFLAVHGTQGAASASVRETVERLTEAVVRALLRSRPGGGTFHIEDVQDHVELGLMRGGHHEVARAYVLYRERRAQERARQQVAGAGQGGRAVRDRWRPARAAGHGALRR